MSHTFRVKKDLIVNEAADPRKKHEYIYDLENTLVINIEILESFIKAQGKFSDKKTNFLSEKIKIICDNMTKKKAQFNQLLKISGKLLMSKQIYQELQRRWGENEEIFKEQLMESSEQIEKKYSFVKQLEKKFEEVEIFVRRECQEKRYKSKYLYLRNYTVAPFMNENEFYLRLKSDLSNEIEIYKKDLLEILKENEELRKAYNENKNKKASKQGSKSAMKELSAIKNCKENKIINSYSNKNKFLERSNQHLKIIYKNLSAKITSCATNYSLRKSPAFFGYDNCNTAKRMSTESGKNINKNEEGESFSPPKSYNYSNNDNKGKDKNINHGANKPTSYNIEKYVNNNFNFNLNIQLYDKNNPLSSIQQLQTRGGDIDKKTLKSAAFNSQEKVNNKNSSDAYNAHFSNYKIYNAISSEKKDKDEKNKSKSKLFEDIIKSVNIPASSACNSNEKSHDPGNNGELITSFDLNINEDQNEKIDDNQNISSPSHVKQSAISNTSSTSQNKNSKRLTSKLSLRDKVNKLKLSKSLNGENQTEQAYASTLLSYTKEKDKFHNKPKEYHDEFFKLDKTEMYSNANIIMETGLEMLPKTNLAKHATLVEKSNRTRIASSKRDVLTPKLISANDAISSEREAKQINKCINKDIENENLNKNIDFNIDFNKHSSIFSPVRKLSLDTNSAYFNIKNISAGNSSINNKLISPSKRNTFKPTNRESKGNVVIPLINLKNLQNQKKNSGSNSNINNFFIENVDKNINTNHQNNYDAAAAQVTKSSLINNKQQLVGNTINKPPRQSIISKLLEKSYNEKLKSARNNNNFNNNVSYEDCNDFNPNQFEDMANIKNICDQTDKEDFTNFYDKKLKFIKNKNAIVDSPGIKTKGHKSFKNEKNPTNNSAHSILECDPIDFTKVNNSDFYIKNRDSGELYENVFTDKLDFELENNQKSYVNDFKNSNNNVNSIIDDKLRISKSDHYKIGHDKNSNSNSNPNSSSNESFSNTDKFNLANMQNNHLPSEYDASDPRYDYDNYGSPNIFETNKPLSPIRTFDNNKNICNNSNNSKTIAKIKNRKASQTSAFSYN